VRREGSNPSFRTNFSNLGSRPLTKRSLPTADGCANFGFGFVCKNCAKLRKLLQFFLGELSIATKSPLSDYASNVAFKAKFKTVPQVNF
jgi:hypothetical protein